jgi:hypothetical protein
LFPGRELLRHFAAPFRKTGCRQILFSSRLTFALPFVAEVPSMRLGDDIDDHCSSCKRTTDHAIVSLVGEEVLRTRCRTCNSEHKYRGNKGRKKEMTAKDAFDTLLASVTGVPREEPKKSSKAKKK